MQAEPAVPGIVPVHPEPPGAARRERGGIAGALRFPFSIADWKGNVGLLILLTMIPVVGAIVRDGYFCEVHQRLARGHDRPLPKLEFDDVPLYMQRGTGAYLVYLAVTLPATALVWGLIFVAWSLRLWVLTGDFDTVVIVAVYVGSLAVVLVVSLLTAVLENAVLTRAELTETFRRTMNVRGLLQLIRGTWFMVCWKTLVLWVVAVLTGAAGLLACGVGLYVTRSVLPLVTLHYRWQVYDRYLEKGGEPIELPALQPLPSERKLCFR